MCRKRHALVVSPPLSRLCEPCAAHCDRCDAAGPNRCDEGHCDGGYMAGSSSGICELCTANCRICHDLSVTGCDKCEVVYRLVGGACELDGVLILQLFVTVIVSAVSILVLLRHNGIFSKRRRRSIGFPRGEYNSLLFEQSSHGAFVAASEDSRPNNGRPEVTSLPSGIWRGYYNHSGARHEICEFTLQFGRNSRVMGVGVDDVGKYVISGVCDEAQSRLAFKKTYVMRSRNVSGVVSYGNKGHSVEYRGELAGGALGRGFHGAWRIRHEIGNCDGAFHIWPAMEGWCNLRETELGSDFESRRNSFEAESECVVCFDRAIGTCLRPCGHQVLCRECADKLRTPRICPICRTQIDHISDCVL